MIAFIAGGCGAWLAVQWVLPQAQELWAVFLCGGLFGLLLYRLWTMLLTSLIGTLLAGHAAILLFEQFLSFDAVAWVSSNVPALNGVVVGLVVLGILLQAVSAPDEEEAEAKDEKKKDKKADAHASDHGHGHGHDHGDHGDAHGSSHPPEHASPPQPKPAKTPWWKKVLTTRKAA